MVIALGLKKVLEYVGDTEHHDLDDPLKGVALGALFGGVVALPARPTSLFKWVVARELNPVRLARPGCCSWPGPLRDRVPALGQLGVVAAIVVAALVVETVGLRRSRAARSGPNWLTTERVGAEGVVWDLGNVLIDWQPLEAVAAGMGDAEARRFLDADDFDFMAWNHVQDAGGSWADAEASVVRSHPQWADHALAYRANFTASLVGEVPGTVDLVRELHAAGVPMWGLTNWSHELYPHAPERFPFLDLLHEVVVSGTEGVAKPDPAIFEIVVARSGRPHRAWSSWTIGRTTSPPRTPAVSTASSSPEPPTSGPRCGSVACQSEPVSTRRPLVLASLTAVVSLALLALAVRFGWLGADVDRGADFCEAAAGRVRQPVNTLSNLGFVVAGLAVAREAWRLPVVGTAYACMVVFLGPASMAMHATESSLGGHLDMLSMYLVASFAVAYAAMRAWRRGPAFMALVFASAGGCRSSRRPAASCRSSCTRATWRSASCSSPRWCSSGGSCAAARPRSTGAGSWRRRGASGSPSRSGTPPRTAHRSAGPARSTRATASGTCCARSRRTACSGTRRASAQSTARDERSAWASEVETRRD